MHSNDLKSLVASTGIYNERELPDEEVNTALLAKQTLCLQSIRGMVMFFVIISSISFFSLLLYLFLSFIA